MEFKCHRKLNLSAPILSTRRIASVVADADTSSSLGAVQNTSERIPFSWEKEAGKPKDMESKGPKLPPTESNVDNGFKRKKQACHWFPPTEAAAESIVDNGDNGCDDEYDIMDDFFSDCMDDVYSLSEALDIVQKKSEKAHSDNNDGLKLKLAESNGYQSPTYMINRFLPDATALAASSSALNFPTNLEENVCDTWSYFPECYDLSGSVRHSYAASSSHSPKGCGLQLLFPWRIKHKFCAIDQSPVLPCSTTNLRKNQRDGSTQKKHHRSSSYIPCTNVKRDI